MNSHLNVKVQNSIKFKLFITFALSYSDAHNKVQNCISIFYTS